MFFDLTLITSLLLVTLSIPIALIIRASILKRIKNKDVTDNESQKKISFQLKILYFFIISIFTARFLFCLSFPEQISRMITTDTPNSVDVLFLVMQVTISATYLFWVFLLSISRHFKLQGRFHLISGQIKKITIFLFSDILISSGLYFVVTNQLLVSGLNIPKESAEIASSLLSLTLVICLMLSLFFFWLTQRKRSKLLYYIFFVLIGISTATALYVSFNQNGLYFDNSKLLLAFTYRQWFYGLILSGFALLAIGSQLLSGIMIRLRSQFINRYFSINYTLQLNRISIVSATALLLSALLPALITKILAGALWFP